MVRRYPVASYSRRPKAPLAQVVADDWFPSRYGPRVSIAFRGGASLANYIRSQSPTLPSDVIARLDRSARYAAQTTGVDAKRTLDAFLANTSGIWDMRSWSMAYQDVGGLTPITGNGQPVRLVKPLTGSNNLVLNPLETPATSDDSLGLQFSNDPISEYRLTTVSAKTFLLAHSPIAHIPLGGDTLDYPFPLATHDTNTYDWHPGSASPSRYFDSTYSLAYSQSVSLNAIQVDTSTLERVYTPHLLTVATTGAVTLSFNSISADRSAFIGNLRRRYSGNYRLLFTSNTNFSAPLLNSLNRLCMFYAGLT